jgi:PmbA protein
MSDIIKASQRFSYPFATLQQIAHDVLDHAKNGGASGCETTIDDGFGQNVTVRRGEVETIEYNRDKGISVTVYIGQKRGHASTSDFSPQAVRETVAAALSIAGHTAEDSCAGLADRDLLAQEFPDLELYFPWDLPVEQAIELAKKCEAAAFAVDQRITNSEGASVLLSESQFIYANSLGFMAGYPASRHSISCAVIASEKDGMQRDYWYTTARDPADLEAADSVGSQAGTRSVRRLGARKIDTCEVPVLFEAPVASSLIGHFVSAVSGGNLYRRSSFLLDSIGRQVFAPDIQIRELPHLKKGLASGAFDDEGVATRERNVVDQGVVQGYFLGSYSGRKLGMRSTGNAGGNHNLILDTSNQLEFSDLLKKMGKGVLVTELLGHGINPVTGDYSRGAAGFWVENGEIQHAVEEITVAGNVKDMLLGICGVGKDVIVRGSKQCGSILIDRMTVAGS